MGSSRPGYSDPLTTPERRRHPRFAVAAPATLTVAAYAVPFSSALASLCQMGCFVATKAGARPGWSVVLTFMSTTGLCGATGSVVREHEGSGFGVEWANINEAFRSFVDKLGAADADGRTQLVESVSGAEVRLAEGG